MKGNFVSVCLAPHLTLNRSIVVLARRAADYFSFLLIITRQTKTTAPPQA